MSDELERADEPVKACDRCGGSGVDDWDEKYQIPCKLPDELKTAWNQQMRNRPIIHKAIEIYLSESREEYLANPDTLSEVLKECYDTIGNLLEVCEVAKGLPYEERGRIFKDAQMALFTITASLCWFHASEGYPQRSSVVRFLEEIREGDRDDEDIDSGADWTGTD